MHPSRVLSFFAEERLDIAKDEGFVSRLVHGILDESFGHDFEKRGCENSFWELSQQLYGHAVEVVNTALRPLMMQLISFQALQAFQEQELRLKGLEYLQPSVTFGLKELKQELLKLNDPGQPEGRELAMRSLNLLGKRVCPAPAGCAPNAMLVAQLNGTTFVSNEAGRLLFGEVLPMSCESNGKIQPQWNKEPLSCLSSSLSIQEVSNEVPTPS